MLGQIFAGPYPAADPDLAFVLIDSQGLAGYIVATADTNAFEQWCEENWWPALREQYPASMAIDTVDGNQDWRRIQAIHAASPTQDELLKDYPAHLHINLIPRAQGAGAGRALIQIMIAALRQRGVTGLHLGVGSGNPDARKFYLAMGFREARVRDGGSTMVLTLRT
ncbi:N-acetyltransferase [Arthrobacter sp. PAMC 25486]|uniref:GNAT family N-acetyltransferase n=1 Tax=Arthrobacter sp. PAMC 25486 TaxID=1494608 RepID=UPI000535BC75|nr:GNAT family N-acetyltransferase [Arthrobacter sp. PAMC 25486]AIY03038.1 N-acetyltransferase [Arthrobacter sp. PAMC 25486]